MQAPTSIGTPQQIKEIGSSEPTPVQGGDIAHALRISHGRRADMAESESEQLALATPARTPNRAEAVTPANDSTCTPFSARVNTEARVQLATRAASPREASPLASSLPNLPSGRQRESWNGESPYRGRSNSGNSSNNSSNVAEKKPVSRSPSPVKALQKTTTLRRLSTPSRAFPTSPPKLQLESRAEAPATSNDTTQVYSNTISLLGLLRTVKLLREKAKPVAGDLMRFVEGLLEEHPDRQALRGSFDRFRQTLDVHVVASSLLAQLESTIGFLPELPPETPDPRLPDLRRQLKHSFAEFAVLANQ